MTGPVGRYGLALRPAALRSLRKLDRQIAERIKAATEALRDDPRPPGAKMLTGSHGLWRIRVGDYRIVYTIDDQRNVVRVAAVGHRRDVYRSLIAADPACLCESIIADTCAGSRLHDRPRRAGAPAPARPVLATKHLVIVLDIRYRSAASQRRSTRPWTGERKPALLGNLSRLAGRSLPAPVVVMAEPAS